MVTGQVSRVGSVGSGILFQRTSLHTHAAMTLPTYQHKFFYWNAVTHTRRNAKYDETDAFLAIDIRILEIMTSGKAIIAVSVSMFVTSR